MSTKIGTVVFAEAEALRQFTIGQNMRVEAWVADNWERVGLTGPIHKSTVSKPAHEATGGQLRACSHRRKRRRDLRRGGPTCTRSGTPCRRPHVGRP
mgnify:CR=1 FL=1